VSVVTRLADVMAIVM